MLASNARLVRLGVAAVLLLPLGLAALLSAQAPPAKRPVAAPPQVPAPPGVFQKYCFECHGTDHPEADLSIERLVKRFSSPTSLGADSADWERVADMLAGNMMPPFEATKFPTDSERASALAWVLSALKA